MIVHRQDVCVFSGFLECSGLGKDRVHRLSTLGMGQVIDEHILSATTGNQMIKTGPFDPLFLKEIE